MTLAQALKALADAVRKVIRTNLTLKVENMSSEIDGVIPVTASDIRTFCSRCTATTFTVPDGVTELGKETFASLTDIKTFNLPNSVKKFGDYAFDGCTQLTEIPKALYLEEIGDYCFRKCIGITTVSFPSSSNIKRVGKGAFKNCEGIIKVDLPKSVTTLENEAFFGCHDIEELNIPGVTHFGDNALTDCGSLTSITVCNGPCTVGYRSFFWCNMVPVKILADTMTTIPIQCFYCSGVANITLPNTVKKIDDEAFGYCQHLQGISFPSGLQSIGNRAFHGCTSVFFVSITLPSSIVALGDGCFEFCENLTTVRVECTTPPSAGTEIFKECSQNLRINVPSASVSAYRSAPNWSAYASKIYGY